MNLKTMLSAGALALMTAVIPTAALANTPPPTKVYASSQGWAHPSIRPSAFYIGLGGAPYFTGLRWQYWRTASAHATGTLWAINQGCTPSYRCLYHPYPLRVLLTVVKRHGSVHYFYKMTATFRRNGAWHTQVAVFKPYCSTCTLPFWLGPSAWPYL